MNEESRRSKIVTAGREEQCRMSSRRRMLLAGTALAGLSTVGLGTPVEQAQARQAAASRGRQEAEHPGHLRRRHRPDERQRLLDGPDGLPHAEHRPDRQGGDDLHRLLRRAELHRRPVVVPHRPVHASAPGLSKVGVPAATGRPAEGGPDDRRAAQAARLRHRPVRQEPPRATATSTCPRSTGSTSSSATSTTSTPRRSPSSGPTRATPSSEQMFGPRGVLRCKATDRDDPTATRAAAGSASRRSRTPAR